MLFVFAEKRSLAPCGIGVYRSFGGCHRHLRFTNATLRVAPLQTSVMVWLSRHDACSITAATNLHIHAISEPRVHRLNDDNRAAALHGDSHFLRVLLFQFALRGVPAAAPASVPPMVSRVWPVPPPNWWPIMPPATAPATVPMPNL